MNCKPAFNPLIAMVLSALLAVQSLSAIADTHLLHLTGAEHSPLDFLHDNPHAPFHHHQNAELSTTSSVEIPDVSDAPECNQPSHTHTCSALLTGVTTLTSLAYKQQNLYFYQTSQLTDSRNLLYRPPKT